MTEQLTLQAGKRYVRRDGEISGVLEKIERDNKDEFLFYDRTIENDCGQYTGLGKYYTFRDDGRDLISEYIEPTAEPQDEWGPWIGWNGGECPVGKYAIVEVVTDAGKSDPNQAWCLGWSKHIIAYRIKKELVVRLDYIWINDYGFCFDKPNHPSTRKAIITLTDGTPSIAWAD